MCLSKGVHEHLAAQEAWPQGLRDVRHQHLAFTPRRAISSWGTFDTKNQEQRKESGDEP
jgi:hypothetical protein